MFSKPSRLQTLLLMLPTWAFAHSVLIFRVLPLNPNGTALVTNQILPFVLLLVLAGGFALLASYVAARRAAASAGACLRSSLCSSTFLSSAPVSLSGSPPPEIRRKRIPPLRWPSLDGSSYPSSSEPSPAGR